MQNAGDLRPNDNTGSGVLRTTVGWSKRNETTPLKRPLLMIGNILAVAAIIAVFINNRTPNPAS